MSSVAVFTSLSHSGGTPYPSSSSSDRSAKMGFVSVGSFCGAVVSVCTYTGTTISFTVSRISTNCAAPVLGCVSSLRRSAQS